VSGQYTAGGVTVKVPDLGLVVEKDHVEEGVSVKKSAWLVIQIIPFQIPEMVYYK